MERSLNTTSNLNYVKRAEESVCFQTTRLIINLVTNILIVLTIFVIFLYLCRTSKLNAFQLHIVLCVLGYQFFMCQGILVLSKYNSWSMFIKRRHRIHLHWILQVLALILIVAGTFIMINEKPQNFNTAHGTLALSALVLTLMGLLNGSLVLTAHKLNSSLYRNFVRLTHYVTGIGTLICAAASLCFGFDKHSFRIWIDNDSTVHILMSLVWVFTLAVSFDLWINTSAKLRTLFLY